VTDTFFRLDGAHYHELAFTYAISPEEPAILDNARTRRTSDGDVGIELRCFDLDRLETVPFQPSIFQPLLRHPPETPQHLVVGEQKVKANRREARSGALKAEAKPKCAQKRGPGRLPRAATVEAAGLEPASASAPSVRFYERSSRFRFALRDGPGRRREASPLSVPQKLRARTPEVEPTQ